MFSVLCIGFICAKLCDATLWTVAHPAPLSMGFSRQECWSGLPCPPPGGLPGPGITATSPTSTVHGILQARILEWVAMPSSGGSSCPRDHSHVSYLHCAWDSPGKNAGVGCHALLRGVFLAPGSQPRLLPPLHWQGGSLPLVPREKPGYLFIIMFG